MVVSRFEQKLRPELQGHTGEKLRVCKWSHLPLGEIKAYRAQ